MLSGSSSTSFLGDAAVLRVLRVVKMMRVSRMARLMRGFPEILVLLKGVKAAFRSVVVFFSLWLIIIYMFALIFRTFPSGELEDFKSVPGAMNTLLLNGILPAHEPIVSRVAAENPFFWIVMMCFIAIASVTLMNMLIGVLVEVVSLISSTEREAIEVMALAQDLREATQHLNLDWSSVGRRTFADLVVDPHVALMVNSYGVDPGALLEAADSVFEELDKRQKPFGFEDLVELVLKMRGKNVAKVRDIKEQVNVIKRLIGENTTNVVNEVTDGFTQLRVDLRNVHEATMNTLAQQETDGSDEEWCDNED